MSSAYVLSSFIRRHTSGILKSFVTYLNISESSILSQMNSHYDYTLFSDMEALISQKYHLCQTQAGNFRFAYCSRALESSDWFPLVTHISSHQSGSTASLMVYVRHQHVNMPAFLRTTKRFMEINSTLPLTKRGQKSSNEGPSRFLPFQVYFPSLFVAIQ